MKTIADRIKEFNKGRLPALLKLKYAAMRKSSFSFYRGTCHLFYQDISKILHIDDPTKVWICGDLHLENFGAYKGDDRQVYFDINDFDEAVLAPATWELARVLVSIHAGAHDLGFSKKDATRLDNSFLDEYCRVLLGGKIKWVDENNTSGLVQQFLFKLKERKRKDFLNGRIVSGKNGLKIKIDNRKTMMLSKIRKQKLIRFLNTWIKESELKKLYQVQDTAVRIAGTGSLGVERYALLVNAKKAPHRHYLLDMKEAGSSSLSPFVKIKQPHFKNEAERIISVQNRMQAVSPAMLTTMVFSQKKFVIKELQPTQDKMDLTLCKGKFKKLEEIIHSMAQITASAQLRSSGRDGSSITDELIAFAKSKKWKRPLLSFCEKYSVKVIADHQSYCKAYDKKVFS